MPIDYAQKQLINAPLHKHRHHARRTDRMQLYAFFTGLMSTLISLAGVLVQAFK